MLRRLIGFALAAGLAISSVQAQGVAGTWSVNFDKTIKRTADGQDSVAVGGKAQLVIEVKGDSAFRDLDKGKREKVQAYVFLNASFRTISPSRNVKTSQPRTRVGRASGPTLRYAQVDTTQSPASRISPGSATPSLS